jgi:hypothetical protein
MDCAGVEKSYDAEPDSLAGVPVCFYVEVEVMPQRTP